MQQKYDDQIAYATRLLPDLEGLTLLSTRVNIVVPEFNVVYLETSDGVFSLQGEVGGEYLGVHRLQTLPELTHQDGYIVTEYEPFKVFERQVIAQCRQIGTLWIGHGFELCFEGIRSMSMIVQSIYSGDKPEGLEDCLRLGIANYENEFTN